MENHLLVGKLLLFCILARRFFWSFRRKFEEAFVENRHLKFNNFGLFLIVFPHFYCGFLNSNECGIMTKLSETEKAWVANSYLPSLCHLYLGANGDIIEVRQLSSSKMTDQITNRDFKVGILKRNREEWKQPIKQGQDRPGFF